MKTNVMPRGILQTFYKFQVQTEFQQVSETKYVITIPDADNVNHIVIFLTGTVPFPEGLGGAGEFFC